MVYFVDTSAFVAYVDKRDINHREAKEIARKLSEEGDELVSTDYILLETYTVLASRVNKRAAIRFGEEIRKDRTVRVIQVDTELQEEGWKIFKKYIDKEFSFVDCTSFALMKREKIDTAFTFDKDFKQFGFQSLSNRY